MQGSKKALAKWEALPPPIRIKLLNNAWCGQCRSASSIADAYLELQGQGLVILGNCVSCGQKVVRCLDN
jgi:ATP diphosphatase